MLMFPTIVATLINWSVCSQHLIGDDPWPYAEVENPLLIEMYKVDHDPQMERELREREKQGLLTEKDVEELNK